MKNNYTREEVISLIEEMLENADHVLDALSNEATQHDAESLLEDAEKTLFPEQ